MLDETRDEEAEEETLKSDSHKIIVLDSDQDDSIIIEECIIKKPAVTEQKVSSNKKTENVDDIMKSLENINLNTAKTSNSNSETLKKLVKIGKSEKKKENLSNELKAPIEVKKKVIQDEPKNDLDIPFSQRMKQRFENAAMFK